MENKNDCNHDYKFSLSLLLFIFFLPVQSARNLRNLPCVVRKSGLKGVCMFAIDCIKSNGTHLGTCIDKFYFGSCCQVKVRFFPLLFNNSFNNNKFSYE